MKITAFALCLLLAASASAATLWFDVPNSGISWLRPDVATDSATKQKYGHPSDGTLAACGWVWLEYEDCPLDERLWGWEPEPWVRRMTQEERDAAAAARAEAEAQAAAQASLPMMNGPGFAATNSAGHWVRFVPDGTNLVTETLAIQISHSPPDPVVAAQMEKDALAARAKLKAAAKTAKGKGNGLPALAERVAALEALNGIE